MNLKKLLACLFLLLTMFQAVSCSDSKGAGVGPACEGYYAEDRNKENTLSWHDGELYTMPSELVKSFAYYTALDLMDDPNKHLLERFLYDYDSVYMKSLLEKSGQTPDSLLKKMNEKAEKARLSSTIFNSITGFKSEEEALRTKEQDYEFSATITTLKDLVSLAKIFHAHPVMHSVLSENSVQFEGQSLKKTRQAPLLRFDSDQYLEKAEIFLAGYGINHKDQTVYIAIASVSDHGKEGFAAVSEYSGSDQPFSFASADVGNLCGNVISEKYALSYSVNNKMPHQGTLVVGTNLFYVITFVIIALLVILILLIIVLGIVVVVKRNREGRRKYRAPEEKNKENDEETKEKNE